MQHLPQQPSANATQKFPIKTALVCGDEGVACRDADKLTNELPVSLLDSVVERPVEFASDGQKLRGILHLPQTNRKRMGVIFLNAGPVNRAGPYRLYAKAARAFCEDGFACLRFDMPGVGESEGEVENYTLDMFSDPSHTINAVDMLMRETGVEEVALLGICTGARSAVWTARKDPRIKSLVLLSMPIMFDRSKTPMAWLRSRQNLRSATLILRLFERLKSTPLWTIFVRAWLSLQGLAAGPKALMKLARAGNSLSGPAEAYSTSPDAFGKTCEYLMATGRRMYFIYGELDQALVSDFQANVRDGKGTSQNKGSGARYDYWNISGANHVFSGIQTQQTLINGTVKWLNRGEE